MRRFFIERFLKASCPLIALVLAMGVQASQDAEIDDLLSLDLNRLINIKVTLSARVAEKAFNAPAAIYVLSREDILRSGHRRLPEVLRMVPGLHVGKWDANKWAVSSRNAMGRFSSTMLVMIDGRHVYTPLFGGVRWEIQDVMLEDIERIEVIRGPGGPLWGANAVDGIISITTRNAKDTQGTLAYAAIGQGEMRQEIGARLGASTEGGINYRVFAKNWESGIGVYEDRALSTHNGRRQPGDDADDRGASWLTGFRADWQGDARDSFSVQANAFRSRFDEERSSALAVTPNRVNYHGFNAMLHWRRDLGTRESMEVRSSVDRVDLADDILEEKQTIFDLDFQHSKGIDNHTLTWGLGYRYYRSETALPSGVPCNTCFGIFNHVGTNQTWSAFVQDQWAFARDWTLVAGAKFEHNQYTGVESQPTLRLSWRPTASNTVWLAGTQAVRMPTRVDREFALFNTPPGLVGVLGCRAYRNGACLLGNPGKEAWRVNSYELGYRVQPADRLALDFAAFDNHFKNVLQDRDTIGRERVYGLESLVRWQAASNWMLELSHTWNVGHDKWSNGATSPTISLPKQRAHLRSQWRPGERWTADVMVYWSEGFERFNASRFPGYTRVDAKLAWRVKRDTEIGLWLSNITDSAHSEYFESLKVNTAIRRGAWLGISMGL